MPGRNIVRLVFPDGTDVPGSPIVRFVEAPARKGPVTYRGAIDSLDGETLSGWAATDEGEECEVTLRVNGGAALRVAASLARPDLIAKRLARRSGGWSAPVGALLGPGENRIEAAFPDGKPLPGSPLVVHRPQPAPAEAPRAAPAEAPVEVEDATVGFPSLAELDDLSLDDISLAVAAGLIDLPNPPAPAEAVEAEPEPPATAEPEVAEAAPPRRGFFARLLGGV